MIFEKRVIHKINSIHFGGKWIGLGILIGGIIPVSIYTGEKVAGFNIV